MVVVHLTRRISALKFWSCDKSCKNAPFFCPPMCPSVKIQRFEGSSASKGLLPLLMTLRRKLGRVSFTLLPEVAEVWQFTLPKELVEVLEKDEVICGFD